MKVISIYTKKMKFVKDIIRRWMKDEKKVLGRWNIEHCDKTLNKKVDLSNEDHCGPCGQYLLNKSKTVIVNINK